MRFAVLFFAIFLIASFVSAQEVGTETTDTPPTLSSILTQTGQSAEAVLDRIRLRLLDEMRVQSDATQSTHLENQYQPIIDAVFGGSGRAGQASEMSELGENVMSGECAPFVGSFGLGDSGDEVRRIQQFLNSHSPETRIAQTGAGSPGNETDYYGQRTFAAVLVFQQKYASDVLAPLNLPAATGYWGASTRSKANALLGCAL